MGIPTNSQYLESKLLTAPPQRLHLLLIEGAIRFGRQAEALLRRNDVIAADTFLMRAIDIAGELLVAVRQNKSAINDKLASFYGYVFRAWRRPRSTAMPTCLPRRSNCSSSIGKRGKWSATNLPLNRR